MVSAIHAATPRGMMFATVPDQTKELEGFSQHYANLTLADLGVLHRKVAERWGVPYEQILQFDVQQTAFTAVPTHVNAQHPSSDESKPASKKTTVEKSSFDLSVTGFPAEAKIKLIKELRGITNLSIADAKSAIDNCPGTLKVGLGKEEATKLKEAFERAGASASLV